MNLAKLNELLLDPEQRHLEPRVGSIGHNLMGIDRRSIDKSARTITFTCSTAAIDRYNERVLPEAFRDSLPEFMACPVFPFGHHYEPIGDSTPTVGHWRDMRIVGDALVGTAWFKPRGLGEACWLDYLEGNMTSVSVAWLTEEASMEDVEVGGTIKRIRTFRKVRLVECSAVLIPANPQARLRAASATAPAPAPGSSNPHPFTDDALEQRIASILERQLDASPGGRLCTLVHDIAEALQGRAGFEGVDDYLGDDPDGEEDDLPSPTDGAGELKALLRDAIGAA